MTGRMIVRRKGFTLIELVVVIAISAILVSFMAMFITTPMEAYFAQLRRAALVDSADASMRMMASDVRTALPNSVRLISNGSVVGIELLTTTDLVEYRAATTSPDPRGVDFGGSDSSFSTMSTFSALPIPAGDFLSIGNAGTPGQDAYELTHVITPKVETITAAVDIAHAGEDTIALSSAVTFTFPSTTHHLFLVSGPIAYLCDTITQTLTRYSGYSIATTAAAHDTAAKLYADGATGTVAAQNLASCQINIVPGTTSYGQLVILRLQLSIGGETLQIMQEMPVDNVS